MSDVLHAARRRPAPRPASLFVFVGSLCLAMGMGGCPGASGDHPPETVTGTVTIPESTTVSGSAATREVSSRWAAPHLNMTLDVLVTSPELLDTSSVRVTVRGTCQLGTTFLQDLRDWTVEAGGFRLKGHLARAANASNGSECVGSTGQKEAVKWTVYFQRPSGTTQELSFEYTLSIRLASIETPVASPGLLP